MPAAVHPGAGHGQLRRVRRVVAPALRGHQPVPRAQRQSVPLPLLPLAQGAGLPLASGMRMPIRLRSRSKALALSSDETQIDNYHLIVVCTDRYGRHYALLSIMVSKVTTCAQMEEHELEALASKSRRTRRPDYEALADMLRVATELPCAPSEEAAFRQLVTDFEAWEVRLTSPQCMCEAVYSMLVEVLHPYYWCNTVN